MARMGDKELGGAELGGAGQGGQPQQNRCSSACNIHPYTGQRNACAMPLNALHKIENITESSFT